jgi:hypothetical protein
VRRTNGHRVFFREPQGHDDFDLILSPSKNMERLGESPRNRGSPKLDFSSRGAANQIRKYNISSNHGAPEGTSPRQQMLARAQIDGISQPVYYHSFNLAPDQRGMVKAQTSAQGRYYRKTGAFNDKNRIHCDSPTHLLMPMPAPQIHDLFPMHILLPCRHRSSRGNPTRFVANYC